MKIYIVIPVYNEEKRISEFIKELKTGGYPFIVVDDGSSDNTAALLSNFQLPNTELQKATKQKTKLHLLTTNHKSLFLRHKVNLGKGAAMKTGAEAAFILGAEAVIFMDGDGQHKVADVDNFVKELNSGKCDIVYGSRNLSHGVPLIRYLGNKAVSVIISLLFGVYISDILCGFRAITKNAYDKILWESRGYAVESEMVVKAAKAGLKHCEVPVSTIYYDKFKGVTVFDAFHILFDLLRWRLKP
jgi:glycosyltransferase involved in cell wall biosynthesis